MKNKGAYRVGIDFNPSGSGTVGLLKSMAADFIDAVEAITPVDQSSGELAAEVGRLKALAQTHMEDAAMWAVKAATKRLPAE